MKKEKLFGPGLITAALVVGPGSITVSSRLGAITGYSFIWVVIISAFMMIIYTRIGAKIGIVLRKSFLTTVAFRFGRSVALLIGLSGFLVTIGFQIGNNIGVGMALETMFGSTVRMWSVLFTLISLGLLWYSNDFYKLIENTMKALIGIMIICFFGNLFVIKPSAIEIIKGFIPRKIPDYKLLASISATTFSVASACFESYLVVSKKWTKEYLRIGLRDAVIGIITVTVITIVILVTSATVLKPDDIKINNAVEMAKQLEPLLGSFSKWMFLLGLWAGAFSSFIISAIMGGTFLADGLGVGDNMECFWSKFFASFVMILGAFVVNIIGQNPIELLIVSQGATILVVPGIAVIMLILSNDRYLMGNYKNHILINIIGILGVSWLIYLSFMQLTEFVKL